VRGYIEYALPDELPLDRFVAELEEVAQCNSGSAFACSLRVDPIAVSQLTPLEAKHIVLIVSEAVSNSRRHAQARTCRVGLETIPSGLCLTIEDDGTGFKPLHLQEVGHGLLNMSVRAKTIQGSFKLSSKPGRGASIRIDIPKGEAHGVV
jgi:signal transduction histidine kinase